LRPQILFDLDGTLTDPKPGITAGIRYATAQIGQTLEPDADLDWCIGPPLKISLTRLLGGPERVPQVLDLYRERYQASGMFENSVYPGIPELLTTLAGTTDLWVATSKPRIFAEKILEHFGLAGYFRGVYGSELDGRNSDKGELIALLLREQGIAPVSAVMIGDREHDIIGAKKNGLRTIGVLWGYGSTKELLDAGADGVVETPGKLLNELLRGPSK
jgi:phosphoglycolate phosphatase